MKDEPKFLCVNAWGCATDYRTHLAFELIRNYGLVTGSTDKDGKVTHIPPEEVVGRAFALVDEWVKVAVSRGEFGRLTPTEEQKETKKEQKPM